jgi:hypothetical protein
MQERLDYKLIPEKKYWSNLDQINCISNELDLLKPSKFAINWLKSQLDIKKNIEEVEPQIIIEWLQKLQMKLLKCHIQETTMTQIIILGDSHMIAPQKAFKTGGNLNTDVEFISIRHEKYEPLVTNDQTSLSRLSTADETKTLNLNSSLTNDIRKSLVKNGKKYIFALAQYVFQGLIPATVRARNVERLRRVS